jgi:drug/metabolite transporter (DMT)-like permease
MTNLQIFVACVAIWGSTWIAITFQLGQVPPEASVCYRFLLASVLLFVYCRTRGLSLRVKPGDHAWLALFGVFMFSVSYVFVYYAEQQVVSGLVAVGYSASPLLGMLGLWLFFRTPMTQRVAVGALLGIVGITLVFLPEFGRVEEGGDPIWGATFTFLAVTATTLGSMVAHRNQEAKLPLWQSMAWGMLYGALFSAMVTLASGVPFSFDATPAYVLSLLYLSVFGSIAAFAGFLTLLGRIGAARAGYVGVMVPIMALVISAVFESFRWQVLTWVGIAVSVFGNVVILRERRQALE